MSNDSAQPDDDRFRGYDLETGLLSRLREWNDVFPWIRLGRVLRVAASPPLILLTAATLAIWFGGNLLLFGEVKHGMIAEDGRPVLVAAEPFHFPESLYKSFWSLQSHLESVISTTVFHGEKSWVPLGQLLWSLLVWTPLALLLARQGALLTAGRTMMGIGPLVKHSLSRTLGAWLAGLVPLACTAMIGLLLLPLGWIASFFPEPSVAVAPLALLAVLLAIPCGVLAFGANFAVPLGWAALANESDPDSLDSLSRGYEYLFRRPLQLVLYAFVAFAILLIVGALAKGVAEASTWVAIVMLSRAGSPDQLIHSVRLVLSHFPNVIVLTLLWSLIGGIYLLLRHDTGGQEVEDLWRPTPAPTPPLPKLPKP
ncbi:MAG: hypothetical protein AB8B91_21210 [Rubripirellula sp.]